MSSPVTVIPHAKYVMARRRINIALCIIEDGMYSLLTSENLVEILSSALTDLEEGHLVERGEDEAVSGLDWNSFSQFVSE